MLELHPGLRLLDRYELNRRLGVGGNAEVWLARDETAGSPVALKFLAAPLCSDDAAVERFDAEWRAIRTLNHPHIVRIFEFHAEPRPFYAMQYVDGSDVSAFADLSPGEWLRAIACAAAALVYAHNRHLAHGDVSARNLLVDSDGKAMLTDFGLGAVPVGAASPGTPAAASPERLAGAGATPADDIHALGVLIFELYHGHGVDEDGPRWPPRDDFDVRALAALVEQMLGPASARPDAEAVADALGGLGVSARPLPRTVSRERAVRPAAVQALAELEPGIVSRSRDRGATPPPPAAASPAGRRGGVPMIAVAVALGLLLALAVWVVVFLPDRVAEQRGQETAAAATGAPATPAAPAETEAGEEVVEFSENLADDTSRDEIVRQKNRADRALGELLTKLEVLEIRGVDRWGGEEYATARQAYADGDEAYLAKNYARAETLYLEASAALDGLIRRVDTVFAKALAAGRAALEAEDVATASRQFELALAITPGNEEAELGLRRAETLLEVIELTDQAARRESDGEFADASERYQAALDLDPYYQPAVEGLQRVRTAIERQRFEDRMTDGFQALADGRYAEARTAFESARRMRPSSPEPGDGLLQVDQAVRLQTIDRLTAEARRQEAAEDWQAAAETYGEILKQDSNLALAKAGQDRARQRLALDRRLEAYIARPDQLSEPATLRRASKLLTDLVRMKDAGPRLERQRDELARLLKRASTPLEVQFVSDGETEVTVFRVGRLGTFESRELELRPGTYTVMGTRIGYRDVRIQFRVAPEQDLDPIVVRCEEPI